MPGQAELNLFGRGHQPKEPCGHCELSLRASEDIRAAPSIPAVTQGWPGHLSLGMPAPPMLLAQPRLPCPLPALGRALLPVTPPGSEPPLAPMDLYNMPSGHGGEGLLVPCRGAVQPSGSQLGRLPMDGGVPRGTCSAAGEDRLSSGGACTV